MSEVASENKSKGKTPLIIIAIIALFALGYGGKHYVHSLSYEDTDNAFIDGIVSQVSPKVMGHVAKVLVKDNQVVKAGDVLVVIDATDIQIRLDSARAALAGAKSRLAISNVDLETVIKTSGPLVEVEKNSLDAARESVETAKIRLSASNTAMEQAKSREKIAGTMVQQANAEVEASEAEAKRAKSDLERYENLFKTGGVTASQLDQFSTVARATDASYRAAKFRVSVAETQVVESTSGVKAAQDAIAQANSMVKESQIRVLQAQAGFAASDIADLKIAKVKADNERVKAEILQLESQVKAAEKDLEYATVTAPISGRVTKKSVEEGNYIRPGQPILGIVADEKWVIANFKETQVEKMKPGQEVKIEVDTYPGKVFKGKIDSIQGGTGSRFSLLPAENATGNYVKVVQRVPVKIAFDEKIGEETVLSLGMSVVPEVRVK